jgi:hypothetical protein
LSLLEFEVDHTDFFLFLTDSLLTILESVFLNVALLIVDAELIISINKLNTHVVSALTSHLIFVNQIIHFFLERVYNEIKLVSFIDLLANNVFLGFVNGNSFVKIGS